MLRVAALTSGRNTPSSRFRVRQHIGALSRSGIDVREFTPAICKYDGVPFWPANRSVKYILPVFALWQGIKLTTRGRGLIGSWTSDITWLERQLLPGYLTLEPAIKRPYVFDVDDAIWMSPPFGRSSVARTARRSAAVLAGNSYLADWFAPFASNIHIVPTAVDSDRFRPRAGDPRPRERFVIGWIGTKGNLPSLEAIEQPLDQFMKRHAGAELLVVADGVPDFKLLPCDRVRIRSWSDAIEVESLQEMDVGLMPLTDSEWARGKCSFKMLQYMACGIPVVVSPVGMNAEVLAIDAIGLAAETLCDWFDALELLYADAGRAGEMGLRGRAVVESRFSGDVIARQIAAILNQLA